MAFWMVLLILFIVCFLLGSIPWGVVISRVFYHTDVRDHGSGNIGATNSLRTLGKAGGAAVFLLDFGKGVAAGLVAWWACHGMGVAHPAYPLPLEQPVVQIIYALAFLACVWGHVFSPWLRFKGGKGIAVAVGCEFIVFGLWPTLLEIAIFALVVAISRRVSAGSLAAAVACPFIALYLYWGNWLAWLFFLLAAVTVIWAHRQNIKRLMAGTESTLSLKKHDGAKA